MDDNDFVLMQCEGPCPVYRLSIDCLQNVFDYLTTHSIGRLLTTGNRRIIRLTRHLTERITCHCSVKMSRLPNIIGSFCRLNTLELFGHPVVTNFAPAMLPKSITRLALNLEDVVLSRQLKAMWFGFRAKQVDLDFADLCAALPNLASLTLLTKERDDRVKREYTIRNATALPLVELDVMWRPIQNAGYKAWPTSLKKLAYTVVDKRCSHNINIQELTALETLSVDVYEICLCARNISPSLQSLNIFCWDFDWPIFVCDDGCPLFPPRLTRLDIDYDMKNSFIVPRNVIQELPSTLTYLRLPHISSDSLSRTSHLASLLTLKCYVLTLLPNFLPSQLLDLPRSLTSVSNCFGNPDSWRRYLPENCHVSKVVFVYM